LQELETLVRESQIQQSGALLDMQRSTANAFGTFRNIMLGALVLGVILLCILTVSVSGSISNQVVKLSEAVKDICRGNINKPVEISVNNELGVLEASTADLIDILTQWNYDFSGLCKKHGAGDTDGQMDGKFYEGVFREMARDVNTLLMDYNRDINDILDCTNALGQGDFRVPVKHFPGKKELYGRKLETLRTNLKTAADNFANRIKDSLDGRANSSDVNKLSGDWARIAQDMNNLLESVTKNIKEASDVLSRMGTGDFSQTATGDFKGDLSLLKQSVNSAAANLSGHIKDIANHIAGLSSPGRTRHEYSGPMAAVKDSFRALESRIDLLEKQSDITSDLKAASRPVPGRHTAASRVNTTHHSKAEAEKPSAAKPGFTAAIPVVNKKVLVAPNASHIYDKKDFGKYK
jgi:methyl-accepting chemotaxis protein